LIASGVRSSCEALPTNRRCPWNAWSSRSSIASNVSASSFTSSGGPSRAIRSCRLRSATRRAVAVIVWIGRSARPAIAQPRPPPATPITPSASSDSTSRVCRVLVLARSVVAWICCSVCSALGGVPAGPPPVLPVAATPELAPGPVPTTSVDFPVSWVLRVCVTSR